MRAREFILKETTQGGEAELAQSQQLIQQTKQAFRQQFKQDLKTNSEHRDRAKQQELWQRGQQGERGIYMPLDPNKYPSVKYFHLFSMDISPATLKPEHRTWLQQQGWQLVHGARDPVHWQYVAKAPLGTPTTGPATQTATQTATSQDTKDGEKSDPMAPKNLLGRLLRFGNVGSVNTGSMASWDDFLIGR